MAPTEFAIVAAALRVGLEFETAGTPRQVVFRDQVERLARHLNEIGDRAQASQLRIMLDQTAFGGITRGESR